MFTPNSWITQSFEHNEFTVKSVGTNAQTGFSVNWLNSLTFLISRKEGARYALSFRMLKSTSAILLCFLVAQTAVACPDWAVHAQLAPHSLLLDGAAIDSRYITVGERGHILVSTDHGDNWAQSKVPTCSLLTAVHMHDDQLAWVVGHDAIILRTEDGGENWKIVHQAPELEQPLLDIWFRNALEGIAIGAYGYYLETGDGGETWSERYISEEDDFHLNAIAATGESTLYIAAEAGNIYRSDDNGANWYKLDSPYIGSWFAVHAYSENEVILAGLRGNIFRSVDGGKNWTKIATDLRATLTDIVQYASDYLLITGLGGALLVSDRLANEVSDYSLRSVKGISSAIPTENDKIILIGESGIQLMSGYR